MIKRKLHAVSAVMRQNPQTGPGSSDLPNSEALNSPDIVSVCLCLGFLSKNVTATKTNCYLPQARPRDLQADAPPSSSLLSYCCTSLHAAVGKLQFKTFPQQHTTSLWKRRQLFSTLAASRRPTATGLSPVMVVVVVRGGWWVSNLSVGSCVCSVSLMHECE